MVRRPLLLILPSPNPLGLFLSFYVLQCSYDLLHSVTATCPSLDVFTDAPVDRGLATPVPLRSALHWRLLRSVPLPNHLHPYFHLTLRVFGLTIDRFAMNRAFR